MPRCIEIRLMEEAITDKTKILVLPFPNNPTGAIMERKDLEEIAEVIIRHDIFVISDEIYVISATSSSPLRSASTAAYWLVVGAHIIAN